MLVQDRDRQHVLRRSLPSMSFFNPPGRPDLSPSSRRPMVLAGVWLGVALAGWITMAWFASRPGSDAEAPARWPSASALERNGDASTLIVFAHPKCPCTAASVAELARIMETCPPKVTAAVVFTQPAGVDEAWTKTRLWEAVGEIPRVRRVIDVDGREARRFGAATAGRTLLYAANGARLFAGGITESRGHRGDNPGETAVVALLRGEAAATQRTPVFGCPLFQIATKRP
jgi:hypothetical protein